MFVCVALAAKYDEHIGIKVSNLCNKYNTAIQVNKEQIKAAEIKVLTILKFEVGAPNIYDFMTKVCKSMHIQN